MIVLYIGLQVLGFYLLYNSSQRARVWSDAISRWFQARRTLAKVCGVAFLLASFALFAMRDGLGAGIMEAVVVLMVVGSTMVLLCPLNPRAH
ncbi:DUF3325 family protein [Chryseolinea lacunae]|uniref:DUF3325 domain-containing protein n=1 Tax=Chryseolinea lacunae TaxID=2801331 RepID=A0ABS1KQ38_9BACT|nr:hypothetical protein [Chryseolinea lacunae]MBL0741428.1 hypothetical protein [Chryseolinea lacunae]